MHRTQITDIRKSLERKMILLSGPRQSGKTTLTRMLYPQYDYLNYDIPSDRLILKDRAWDRKKELIIFDELHKMRKWKSFLKGIYDADKNIPPIIVTGSARLNISRKMGDSLAGRFFPFRLHPIDVKEATSLMPAKEALERILRVGGFPEPFLENSDSFYRRWRISHQDIILRQDLLDLGTAADILAMETLTEMLRHRVGSPVSYASLARDLEKDAKTVKRYLGILEEMYVVFSVRPFSRNIGRAILKEPKYYFYDTGAVEGDTAARLENAVATSLHKELDYIQDTEGYKGQLFYLRNKEKKEVDFAVFMENKITHLFEVKLSDTSLSRSFATLGKYFPDATKIQLVKDPDREKTYPTGEEIRDAAQYLGSLSLLPARS